MNRAFAWLFGKKPPVQAVVPEQFATAVVAKLNEVPAQPVKEPPMSVNQGTGTIPATSLFADLDSLFFLLQTIAMFPGNNNLAFQVLSGDADDINEVINYAHTTGQEPLVSIQVKDWMTGYKGPLREAVKPHVKATIDGRRSAFSRKIYQGYYDKYLA